MTSIRSQQLRSVAGLAVSIAVLHLIPNRLLVLGVLAAFWSALFFPPSAGESIAFVVAALFFSGQNYVCLKAGLFAFRFQDVLLMPYYEPALWGFYFLNMKRFVSGRSDDHPDIDWKSVVGLVATSLAFSLFSFNARALLLATAATTTFLFVLFHTRSDIQYAAYALVLGFIVELFGVSTGLWWYPAPDFLGIPFWFATMWISVGLLGRRFLFPLSEWLAVRARRHRE